VDKGNRRRGRRRSSVDEEDVDINGRNQYLIVIDDTTVEIFLNEDVLLYFLSVIFPPRFFNTLSQLRVEFEETGSIFRHTSLSNSSSLTPTDP
jgi:hypothetical protein